MASDTGEDRRLTLPNFSRSQARGTDHTDAKVNALARQLLQQTSARNADSSTVSPGSELNLKGDIRITDQGEIKVITREPDGAGGFNEVIAHIGNTSIDTHSALSQSPAIWFTSSVDTPQGPRAIPARISSDRGQGIVLQSPTDDSSYGAQTSIGVTQDRFSAGTFGASAPDGSSSGGGASLDFTPSSLNLSATKASTGSASVNSVGMKAEPYSETSGPVPELEFMAGHTSNRYVDGPRHYRARLRTRGAGEFWLESLKPDNTILGMVYTTGDGKVRIMGSASVELDAPTNINALLTAQSVTSSGTIQAATIKATGQVQGASASFAGDVSLSTINGQPYPPAPAKLRFKNQPITIGAGPYAANSVNAIGPAISIPANPYGAGVGYLIKFVGQTVSIAGAASAVCQTSAKLNGTSFAGSYSPSADVANRLLINLNVKSVAVSDGSASSVSYEWTPLYTNATKISTTATDSFFEVTIEPYTTL